MLIDCLSKLINYHLFQILKLLKNDEFNKWDLTRGDGDMNRTQDYLL